jgi:peptidoglycan/xylan/chitin deacetylase (PgdA/CDA1 family)
MQAPPLILAYHAVSSTWSSSLAIPAETLSAQLHALRARGYVGLTLSEAERKRRAGTLPPRALVVTFDDGYRSTLRARPVLAAVGFPATVFVVTGSVGTERPLSWPGIENWVGTDAEPELCPLGWVELSELAADGWEVASHTVTHPLLTRLGDHELAQQLERSRAEIVERLGTCSALSYPYGIADARVAAAAARAGYEVACTLTWVELQDEPLRRPRVGLDRRDDGVRLLLKVSGARHGLRRSAAARLARRIPRRRAWLPR